MMLTVTERAATAIEEVRSANEASAEQGVRLTPDDQGRIGMTLDTPQAGDEVIRRGETPLVIVDSRIVPAMDGVELDCEMDADEQRNGQVASRFTLRRLE